MTFDINSTGGLIRFGSCAILWENSTEEFPGFTAFSIEEYSLEFGEIDSGNGIFLTHYSDGDIQYTQPLLLI